MIQGFTYLQLLSRILQFMSLIYGLCFSLKILFTGGNLPDVLQNVYIRVDCHSWRQLSINPFSFVGKDVEVNGWLLSDLISA